jgi:hypothetical protein
VIKLTVEGEGEEIVAVLHALQSIAPASTFDPTLLLGLDDHSEEEEPTNGAAIEPAKTPNPSEEVVRAGCDVWYGIIHAWEQGFGDEEADQPDRGELMIRAINTSATDIFAFLRYCNGLTRLVRTCRPDWSTVKSRLIAENIASVSSALGIPGIADHLEYTNEYTREVLGT